MNKKEILKEIKELKEMLEMNSKEWAKVYGEKFGCLIKSEDVYPYKTGVAISELEFILERAANYKEV